MHAVGIHPYPPPPPPPPPGTPPPPHPPRQEHATPVARARAGR
eukprot:COSAG01_NODE_12252_length_1773_cov_1.633214_4_plen_42_part_01